jgi:uncharacterized protein (TIGR02118 family)
MITRLSRAPKAADLSYPEFQAHWRSDHASAVTELPGLRRYVQNHSVLQDGRPLLTATGYDASAELDFDDVAAMERAFDSPRQASKVKQDQGAMIDRSGLGLAFVEGSLIYSERSPTEGAVKLMLFLERDGARSGEDWRSTRAEPLLEAIGSTAPAPFRLELLTAVVEAHPPSAPPFCDAVCVAWFDDGDDGLECWKRLAPAADLQISPLLATPVRIA